MTAFVLHMVGAVVAGCLVGLSGWSAWQFIAGPDPADAEFGPEPHQRMSGIDYLNAITARPPANEDDDPALECDCRPGHLCFDHLVETNEPDRPDHMDR